MKDPKLRRNVLLAYISIVLMCFMWMCSCTPRISAILPDSGRIIEQDGNRLLIMWKNVGHRPNSYSWEWVYLPEIGTIEDPDNYQVIFTIKPKYHDPAH
jgi:hypothetical protein